MELCHRVGVRAFDSIPYADTVYTPNILCLWQPFPTFPHCGWLGSPSKTSVWSLDLEGGSQAPGAGDNGGVWARKSAHSQAPCSPTLFWASRVLKRADRCNPPSAAMCYVSKAISPQYAWATTLSCWASGTGMNYRNTPAPGTSDPTMTMMNPISRLSATLLTEPKKKQQNLEMVVRALCGARSAPGSARKRRRGPLNPVCKAQPARTRASRYPALSGPKLTCTCAALGVLAGLGKKPKEPNYSWFDRGYAEPNDQEMLLFALVAVVHASRAGELGEWAAKVVKETAEAKAAGVLWKPSLERWPTPFRKPSVVYEPLSKGFNGSWAHDEYDRVRLAMQAWDGPGQIDGLTVGNIKAYINPKTGQPLGARADAKTKPPPRWRTWAVVKVAKLIKDHGREFRRLLLLDSQSTPVPTSTERIAAAKAEAAAAKAEAVAAKAEAAKAKAAAAKIQDAHRKMKERQKGQREAAKVKAANHAKVQKEAQKAREKQWRTAMRAKLQEAAQAKAEASVVEELAKQREKISKARARARAVESDAKLSKKRLARAQTAEAKAVRTMRGAEGTQGRAGRAEGARRRQAGAA